jgi:hypothetical protein
MRTLRATLRENDATAYHRRDLGKREREDTTATKRPN